MARLEGTRLGAYEIGDRVGSGGMAEVYRAKQRTAFDREVAIKVIRKGYSEDEDFRARFLREARAISLLSHLNILPLIEFGENKDGEELLYLVMPYVAGGTLRDRIKKEGGPLPLRDTVRIFSQLCEAVEHAHQHGLVHRDIKPSNVLLQDGRNVLLADFGIALDTGDARLTGTGMGLGTAEYMAPEQAKGQADKRSDVYSLGVVLYVMLTGQAPYSGSTPFDVLLKHSTEPIPPIAETNPEVPEPIVKVVETAMAKKPEDRFQSVQAMLNAFEQAILQVGPQAISSLQWSGSLPVVRLSDLPRPQGHSNPASGPAISGGAAPISGPSGPSSAPPISGPSGGMDMSEMPTVRSTPGGSRSLPPAASGAMGSADLDLPTVVSSDPATISSNTGVTKLAPQPSMPQSALYQSGPVPAISMPRMPAVQPAAPLSAPPSGPFYQPSGPLAPVPPARKPRNKLLIAVLIALIIVILGGSASAAVIFLRGKQTTTTPGATQTTRATQTTAFNPVFTPGSPCTQALNPSATPASKPGSYSPVHLIDRGLGGAPSFVAVHHDGTVYYTDQLAPGLFSVSPALSPDHNQLHYITPHPASGIAITPNASSLIYYLQPGQTPSGQPAELIMEVAPDGTSIQLASIPQGAAGLALPGLSINPKTNALLIPDPATGTLYCLSSGGATAEPVITGLQQPISAVADAAGNLYVADAQANLILRFNPTGSAPAWKTSLASPQDLTLDKDGNLLATVLGSGPGHGEIVRLNPVSGQEMDVLAQNLNRPTGITLDTSMYNTGIIYFLDQGANTINELIYA